MTKILTFKASPDLATRLSARSAETGLSRSEVIRSALEFYFQHQEGRAANPGRLALVCEYSQLILEVWLAQNAPERREELVSAARGRIEKFHGG
ncbi:ribbon-helix-helix protein, CopG family [Sphingobium sp. B11D3A]|uniref:ribbon-helix-helix protein, CopG family n=1 Tax=Sphingobium sp. B11D3A TaxID=2940574 RepID=UPI0022241844|nr:ribbon-helix-helix protein, CopG family [Sphingobium sp. B11D3A]MCW2393529.1 metal-responsive CopG/Arc/MetJ family transcriptional regulator [Sphingobium sp. B11D3A]